MRVGVDLGGTKILAAVLKEDGTVVARAKNKTSEVGNDAVFSLVAKTIHEALDKADIGKKKITAIGAVAPGPIDAARGIVLMTPNLGLKEFDFGDRLQREFDSPSLLENDVNAGVWGEYIAGAAQGYSDVVGIFPGTGIGGGIVLDGRLYRGKQGSAGEIGHMIVQSDGRRCGCGGHGCLETVASKTAIGRDLVMLAANGDSPTLAEAGATDIKLIKSGLIKKAYAAGEQAVIDVVDRAAYFLGVGLANVVNIFDPELIVLGGGLVEKLGKRYLSMVDAAMRERAMPRLVEGVEIKEAALGDDAVVVGVADLAGRMVLDGEK